MNVRRQTTRCLLLALATMWLDGGPLAQAPIVERARKIDAECVELETGGRSALAAGRHDQALELFERLIAGRLESPFIRDGAGSNTDALSAEMASFVRRVEVILYHRAVALKAFTLWSSGDRRGSETALDWTARDDGVRSDLTREQQQRRRRVIFSELIAAYAVERFDGARWREAADAYAEARAQRLRANPDIHDEESARQQYNQAMAEYKDGRNGRARELLLDLRARMPEYRQGQIEQALENIPRS